MRTFGATWKQARIEGVVVEKLRKIAGELSGPLVAKLVCLITV